MKLNTVTNAVNASPVAPVELDPQLRQRQATSTAIPSQTVAAGIFGAIQNLTDVTAVSPEENDTDTTDANGVRANALAFVVQGATRSRSPTRSA
jgi:hypothetical protein